MTDEPGRAAGDYPAAYVREGLALAQRQSDGSVLYVATRKLLERMDLPDGTASDFTE